MAKKKNKNKKLGAAKIAGFDKQADIAGLSKEKKKEIKEQMRKQRILLVGPQQNKPKKIDLEADKEREAFPPGKRVAKDGDIYYEYRKNRSDKIGKKI